MASVVSSGVISRLTSGPVASPLWVVDPGYPLLPYEGGSEQIDPAGVWATQQSVRKVVDFIARAMASTPLKVYRRVSDTDRQRVTDHPLARVLASPSIGMTPFRFWHSLIVDWLVFDRWAALKAQPLTDARVLDLVRLPATRFRFTNDGLGRVKAVRLFTAEGNDDIDPSRCVFDHGYSPEGANGTTPMRTLAAILFEARESIENRRALWKRGPRASGVIERPASAGAWTEEQRERFRRGWDAYSAGGARAGGTVILEDGMTLNQAQILKPSDANDIEGRQLTDAEVASSYHIAPELVGAREGTYSNVDAFKSMLYGPALGPLFIAWQQTLNTMLVPDLDPTGELYIEADVESKMRGSFQEQAAVLSTSVGAPWLTRNEARGRMNLPAIEGGDALVTPLNVIEGGQASPRDTGSQNLNGREVEVKARADSWQGKAEKVLKDFFRRQERSVRSALGVKAAAWWDEDRWNSELSDDLFRLAASIASEIGPKQAAALGFHRDDYDVDRTLKFLRAVADRRSQAINAATRSQIESALRSDEPDDSLDSVFTVAQEQRSGSSGAALVTFASAFAVGEAAHQLLGSQATKTWITGPNPRPEHAAMNGETVPLDEAFSNGMMRPGDSDDPDLTAGCNCQITVQRG